MKKEYVAPALDIIEFDLADIITHSNAGEGEDNSDGPIIGPKPRNKVASFSTKGLFTPNVEE
ncbi:MAG: hypothetical protein E7586_03950 [Ruminococcaceae bacterium]|nr:hypothetical protein [Oscillospiraceae bacterium]